MLGVLRLVLMTYAARGERRYASGCSLERAARAFMRLGLVASSIAGLRDS